MRWKKFTNSKYFFTVLCLSFILLITVILIFVPVGANERKMNELWNQGKEAATQQDYAGAAQKMEEAVSYIGNTINKQNLQLVEELVQVQILANLPEKAIETCTRLIEVSKENAKFYMMRGKLYDQIGQFSLCLDDYKNAVNADPYNKEVYEMIAQQLEEKGHLNEAQLFRDTALQFLGK